jgi:hypothetical protein
VHDEDPKTTSEAVAGFIKDVLSQMGEGWETKEVPAGLVDELRTV